MDVYIRVILLVTLAFVQTSLSYRPVCIDWYFNTNRVITTDYGFCWYFFNGNFTEPEGLLPAINSYSKADKPRHAYTSAKCRNIIYRAGRVDSADYGFCWGFANGNFTIAQAKTWCQRYDGQLPAINSYSKADKLARFTSSVRHLYFNGSYDHSWLPYYASGWKGVTVWGDMVTEQDGHMVWKNTQAIVSYEGFDESTEKVTSGSSCTVFDMTTALWRFSTCRGWQTFACEESGHDYEEEDPDEIQDVTTEAVPTTRIPDEEPTAPPPPITTEAIPTPRILDDVTTEAIPTTRIPDVKPTAPPPPIDPDETQDVTTEAIPTSRIPDEVTTEAIPTTRIPDEVTTEAIPTPHVIVNVVKESKPPRRIKPVLKRIGPHISGVWAANKYCQHYQGKLAVVLNAKDEKKVAHYVRGYMTKLKGRRARKQKAFLSPIVHRNNQFIWKSTGQSAAYVAKKFDLIPIQVLLYKTLLVVKPSGTIVKCNRRTCHARALCQAR